MHEIQKDQDIKVIKEQFSYAMNLTGAGTGAASRVFVGAAPAPVSRGQKHAAPQRSPVPRETRKCSGCKNDGINENLSVKKPNVQFKTNLK